MSKEELRKSLSRLRNELQDTEHLDEKSKEKLLKLKTDIEQMLESDDSPEEHDSLMENLKESVTHFEASHPKLAESMHIVIHTLSNMGI